MFMVRKVRRESPSQWPCLLCQNNYFLRKISQYLQVKRTYNEVFCLCHRDFTENQVGLPVVDPARLQAAQAVSQRNVCDINKRPRHIFSLGIQS